MRSLRYIGTVLMLLIAFLQGANAREESETDYKEQQVDVNEIVFGHIGDSYEWHITDIGDTPIAIPLPVIVKSSTGWHVFLSSRFEEGNGEYEGLYIAKDGEVGMMEACILAINDDVIKGCIGKDYKRYAPYLLTAFFFILINNLMGLIPFFPGGANITGNIAVTFVLAICTFLAVNLWGNKEYWKEILWPDVPWWLKAPFPMMPIIEIFGIFTKPFALMIRLFANMMAGHAAILSLISIIFITANMGPLINGSMGFVAVAFGIFMTALELLVAFIQAYVFTMLSAVFIGLSRTEEMREEKEMK
ncbi:MAG: F0F1 ATP synthase subunit A [Phocaeicola vulgatus]|nr:F0F1 ATP synthase subunit A [Phocaeicola vulgatus]